MTRFHFHTDQADAATDLVMRFHYSRKMPTNVSLVATAHADGGLFGDFGPAVAACVMGIPGTRWSEPVYELMRLVRDDAVTIPLSSLVSWAVRRLRAKGADLLVSFADATHEHHGGIYQACGWRYDGQRDRNVDGLVVNGRFMAGRACNHRFGTRSPSKVAALHPEWSVEPHYDEGKHLYWLPLTIEGKAKAQRLGLRGNAYPKPHRAGSIESDASVKPHGRRGRKSRLGALGESAA